MAHDALEEQGYTLEWVVLDDGYRYVLRDQEQEVVDVAWSACPRTLLRELLRLAGFH